MSYTKLLKTLQPAPYTTKLVNNSVMSEDWSSWLQTLEETVRELNTQGLSSQTLNPDFNFNTGVGSIITQADANGTYISEKWQVYGNTSGTYYIRQDSYTDTDEDSTGSDKYLYLRWYSYSSGDFYFYQEFSGAKYIRRYQNKTLTISTSITLTTNDPIKCQLAFYINWGSDTELLKGNVVKIAPGKNVYYSTFNIPSADKYSTTGTPTIEYRIYWLNHPGGTPYININYIKAELNDKASPLMVDHFLERTRIDNA